jgi:hypothetical protein
LTFLNNSRCHDKVVKFASCKSCRRLVGHRTISELDIELYSCRKLFITAATAGFDVASAGATVGAADGLLPEGWAVAAVAVAVPTGPLGSCTLTASGFSIVSFTEKGTLLHRSLKYCTCCTMRDGIQHRYMREKALQTLSVRFPVL